MPSKITLFIAAIIAGQGLAAPLTGVSCSIKNLLV
jgi:hypothetical protein